MVILRGKQFTEKYWGGKFKSVLAEDHVWIEGALLHPMKAASYWTSHQACRGAKGKWMFRSASASQSTNEWISYSVVNWSIHNERVGVEKRIGQARRTAMAPRTSVWQYVLKSVSYFPINWLQQDTSCGLRTFIITRRRCPYDYQRQ